MTAAALARVLGPRLSITLVESSEIGIVGVGEATIPAIEQFNRLVKIDEDDFLRQTQGTFKLGIEFVDWYEKGQAYMHAFGPVGRDLAYIPFHHYWLRDQADGHAGSLWDYSLNWLAAKQARFSRVPSASPTRRSRDSPGPSISMPRCMPRTCRASRRGMGVRRIDAKIAGVLQSADGDVQRAEARGRPRARGGLLHRLHRISRPAHRAGAEDRLRRLVALAALRSRAWRCPSARTSRCCPTRARRRSRPAGNGAFRCSIAPATATSIARRTRAMSARASCCSRISTREPLAEPRLIRFMTGRRKQLWNRNVVCMGLASGFLEPLESTSIHLIQVTIQRLILLFPHQGDIEERRARVQPRGRRGVRVHPRLHHPALLRQQPRAASRSGTPAGTCRSRIRCAQRIELFRETAGIFCATDDLFQLTSWLQVLWGQGVRPRGDASLRRGHGAARIARAIYATCAA